MAGTSTTTPGLASAPLLPTTTQSLPRNDDDNGNDGTGGTGASLLQRFWQHTRNIPSQQASLWFCPAYVVDWGVLLILRVFDWGYIFQLQPFERDVKHYLTDPNLTWTFTGYEQVPYFLLLVYTVQIPIVTLIVLCLVSRRRSTKLLHHTLLALFTSFTFAKLTSDIIKLWVGRLRPDFLSRCQYDPVLDKCTGDPIVIFYGRQSFPSGHSAFSFASLGFVALWVAGRNGALAIGSSRQSDTPTGSARQNGPLSSRLLRLLVVLPWWFLAAWIAITRLEDHWHHPTDVLAGSFIGLFVSLVTYLWYFPNPFDGRDIGKLGVPRDIYQPVEFDDDSAGERQWLLGGR